MPRLSDIFYFFRCPFLIIRRRIFAIQAWKRFTGAYPASLSLFRITRCISVCSTYFPASVFTAGAIQAVLLLYLYWSYPLKYSTQSSKNPFILAVIPCSCSGIFTTSSVCIFMYLICEESIFFMPSTFSA